MQRELAKERNCELDQVDIPTGLRVRLFLNNVCGIAAVEKMSHHDYYE